MSDDMLKEEISQLRAQIAGLNLAADQYSESRDKWHQEAKRLRDIIMAARFTLAMASQQGQPPLDCPRLRDVVRQAHETLKTVDKQ